MSDTNAELVVLLKEIRDYVRKQDDDEFKKVPLRDAPKAGETETAIEGGSPAPFKAGEDVVKQVMRPEMESDEEIVKDVSEPEMEMPEVEMEEEKPEPEEALELKALLKDVKMLLAKNATLQKNLENVQKSIDKQVQTKVSEQMRKMGYTPTRTAVTRLGIDQLSEVKKSADTAVQPRPEDVANELSKMSWEKLAKLREDSGDLKAFNGWFPTPDKK